jgi:hypothetical protein
MDNVMKLSLAVVLATGLMLTQKLTAAAVAAEAITVNGQVIPARILLLQEKSVMLDAVDERGNRVLVIRGKRLAGTRAAIHMHLVPGHTCILSGEITAFFEGREPTSHPAATCFILPEYRPMAAANLGTVDAMIVDHFSLPPPGMSEAKMLERYPSQ